VKYFAADGCKSFADIACHCKNGPAQVQPCVQGTCSEADLARTLSSAQTTCAGAGYPVSLPEGYGTPKPQEPAPAPADTVSPAVAFIVSSVESAASSQADVASSAAAAASSLASKASAVATGNATVGFRPTAAVPSSLPEYTGAAAQATQAVGLVGAAALALLAL